MRHRFTKTQRNQEAKKIVTIGECDKEERSKRYEARRSKEWSKMLKCEMKRSERNGWCLIKETTLRSRKRSMWREKDWWWRKKKMQ